MKRIKEKIEMFIAWHLPHQVLMWAFVRVMARAWVDLNKQPDEITYSDAFKVWKKEFK